jgi:DNA polymerase-3 subunit alpha
MLSDSRSEELPPRMLTVVLRATGNKDRDVRRLRHIHGMLRSCPGKDHFAFMLFEGGHYFLIEFPNETTGISLELVRRMAGIVGEENIRVEPIQIQ